MTEIKTAAAWAAMSGSAGDGPPIGTRLMTPDITYPCINYCCDCGRSVKITEGE